MKCNKYWSISVFLLLVILHLSAAAQVKLKTAINVPMLAVNGAFQVPGGDLAKRFGVNAGIGTDLLFKTKKNILYGVYANFMFSNGVKEDSILRNIETDRGFVLSGSGQYAEVKLYERGFNIGFRVGKVFPVIGPNPNSGLVASIGVGLLQHKIHIQNLMDDTPQLNDDYRKGYDRLTNGLTLTEFIGYLNLDTKKLINYYAGFEFVQGFTQNRRSYNYDTMTRDASKRVDLLNGFRIGIIVPFYPKIPNDFYIN